MAPLSPIDALQALGLAQPPSPGSVAPSGTFGAPAAGGGILGGWSKWAPLLEAAAAGYLNYIGSPRREGRGAALRNAGLGALGMYGQAEEQLRKAPLEQAQLQNLQQATQTSQQHGQLFGAQAAALAPDPAFNQQLADVFHQRAQDPSLTPQQKAVYDILTPSVAAGKIKPQIALKMAEDGDVAAAHIAQMQATAAKDASSMALDPLRAANLRAGTAERGTASARNIAEANRANRPPVGKAPDPNAVAKIYQSAYGKARQSYLATHKLPPAPSGIAGYFADPAQRQADEDKLQSEADAYAHEQASGAVEKLNFGGEGADTATHMVKLKDGREVPARLGPDGNYYPVTGGGSGG